MKKITTSVLALFISTCCVQAQTGEFKTGSLLWRISGKDLTKPSYVFGTLHLKPGDFLETVPGARAALNASEQVIGEVKVENMMQMQVQMQQAMMMPSSTTYKMLYTDEEYQFVSEQLASFIGVGLDHLGMIKPAGIQLTIAVLAYARYLPEVSGIEETLDIFIQTEAIRNGKPVQELETVESQIHALFGASLQRQAELLLCGLRNMEQQMALVPKLIEDYTQANLNNLYGQLRCPVCPATPEEINALNKDRNEAWMKILPQMMREKSSFIAVGALHLAGADGLLNLLHKAGYTVEAVVR